MGFPTAADYWGFIAPDLDSFHAALDPLLPPVVPVPGLGFVPRAALVDAAWAQPYTAMGIYARAYWISKQNVSVGPAIQAVTDAVIQQTSTAPGGQITIGGKTVMAALVIPNVYRCAVQMAAGGKPIVNVLHLEGSASGQEAAAAAAVLAGMKVATGPLTKLSSLVSMVSVTAMDLSSTSGGISVVTDATAGSISASNSLATRGACALVKLNGGTRSRSTRGRIYFGPVMESNINSDGATLTAGDITAFNTAWTNFRTSTAGAGFTLGVASRALSSFTTVTTTAVETTIATQRRRIRS